MSSNNIRWLRRIRGKLMDVSKSLNSCGPNTRNFSVELIFKSVKWNVYNDFNVLSSYQIFFFLYRFNRQGFSNITLHLLLGMNVTVKRWLHYIRTNKVFTDWLKLREELYSLCDLFSLFYYILFF